MDNVAYRQLDDETARRELAKYQDNTKMDIEFNIAKVDFHLRPFANFEQDGNRLMEIRNGFLSCLNLSESDLYSPNITRNDFDRIIVQNIQNIFFDLNEYDASQKMVWNYLTVRVLLDIAHIRFPDNAEERYLGEVRNTFRRLWQRATILGPDLASQLQEDEGVQIFERTESLGSNVFVSIALAKTIIEIRQRDRSASESIQKLMKESTKRLRRSMFMFNLHAISEEQVLDFVRNSMYEAWGSLNGSGQKKSL